MEGQGPTRIAMLSEAVRWSPNLEGIGPGISLLPEEPPPRMATIRAGGRPFHPAAFAVHAKRRERGFLSVNIHFCLISSAKRQSLPEPIPPSTPLDGVKLSRFIDPMLTAAARRERIAADHFSAIDNFVL